MRKCPYKEEMLYIYGKLLCQDCFFPSEKGSTLKEKNLPPWSEGPDQPASLSNLIKALCYLVLVFFSPFSIAITSLGEESAR